MVSKPKSNIPTIGDLGAMWQASGLKEKLIFTIAMIALFRLGAQIPVWGINAAVIQAIPNNQLIGMLDMFSGGALSQVSIVALGIGPYITASIIMQLLTVVIPRLEELQKEEGEAGRRKIGQYTRYLAVFFALLQSVLIMRLVASLPGALMPGVDPVLFYPLSVLSLTGGALLALWISEMISDRGIGNGGSLLILSGILTRLPIYASKTGDLVAGDGGKSFALLCLLLIYMVTIGLIIILQEANRKVFVVSAKRQVGNKLYGGQNTHIPFKINPAGVMPIIFAFSILMLPNVAISLLQQLNPNGMTLYLGDFSFNPLKFYAQYLGPGTIGNIVTEFLLIVFFTFFYASIIPSMQPREIAENLKRYGSSIPGIKPGKPTADKLEEILTKTTLIGAVALASITLLASSATSITGITTLQGLGSTSLIIMVGVALDTVNQIRVHLLARQYEGFLK